MGEIRESMTNLEHYKDGYLVRVRAIFEGYKMNLGVFVIVLMCSIFS